jgi:type I restriction-modification system DNA methylase subunit
MTEPGIIEQLGFDNLSRIPEKGIKIKNQLQGIGIEIDDIYFCIDEHDVYPAVFLKRVETFDPSVIKNIVEIQRQAWNYKQILFLYVYTDVEVRIYNCTTRPIIKTINVDCEKEIKELELYSASVFDTAKLERIVTLFSAIAIDTGIIWTATDAAEMRKKINIKTRVDKYLVESLINTSKKLMADGLDYPLIHKLMIRSLFLLYLEDRGATDKAFYENIKKGASSYFDILDDVSATYSLYKKLDAHFNGNLFVIDKNEKQQITSEHLRQIKKCFISGYDGTNQSELFPDWRIFDFKIIQIELLSEIYEHFLAETDPDNKQQTGTFYTPPSLVEFMLKEKLSTRDTNSKYNVKVLDPACGSGIFLMESFKRLITRYENRHNGEKLTDYETLKDLLVSNIFGVDINAQAIKIAAFSLYLALLENLDPKTLWQEKKLPYLVNDPDEKIKERQGENLFRRDTIEDKRQPCLFNNTDDLMVKYCEELYQRYIENQEFDLVIGNPPFGEGNLSESISRYCSKYDFAQEQVLPFLHKAAKFSPNGDIALISSMKILTNNGATYQNFREWLFDSCHVEKIFNFSILRKAPHDFGGKLFNASDSPVCIIFYKNTAPRQASNRIMYYAPKTFIKSNVLEGIVIDSTDIKYLPYEECKKSDTKIWKIAMLGGGADINLIKRLTSMHGSTIVEFANKFSIKSGVGFQLLTEDVKKPKRSSVLAGMKYLDARRVTRYFTPGDVLGNARDALVTKKSISYYKKFYNVSDVYQIKRLIDFRRLGDLDAYKAPHIVVKKGLKNNRVCASFIDADCSFKDGVYGFYSKNIDCLKAMVAYFNSKLSTYFLFMTISSYGIEREQIMKEEYLSIPILLNEKDVKNIAVLISDFLQQTKQVYPFEADIPKRVTDEIENIIACSLSLTEKDIIILNDAIAYNLDLFQNKGVSQALLPVSDMRPYAIMICKELNDFLENQVLYANSTIFHVGTNNPLAVVKISFTATAAKEGIAVSSDNIHEQLNKINRHLWQQQAGNIYFRKKLNYYDGDDVYIIRPNQRRFWSQSAALDDASELILEGLIGD